MSNNPFGEQDRFGDSSESNPYAAPQVEEPAGARGNPVLAPGIILLILSGLFLLLLLLSVPGQVIRLSQIDLSAPEGLGEFTGGIVALIAWFALTIAILIGSIGMIRLQGYPTALIAAVAASLPCCSPFFVLGIPFGIWALVVLMRGDARDRFG